MTGHINCHCTPGPLIEHINSHRGPSPPTSLTARSAYNEPDISAETIAIAPEDGPRETTCHKLSSKMRTEMSIVFAILLVLTGVAVVFLEQFYS